MTPETILRIPLRTDFRDVRMGLNISQAELARLCGIGQSSLSRFESAVLTPSFPTLVRLSTTLQVCSALQRSGADFDVNVIRQAIEVEFARHGF